MQQLHILLLAGGIAPILMLAYASLKARGGFFRPFTWVALLCGMGSGMPALGAEMVGQGLQSLLPFGAAGATGLLCFGIIGPAEELAKLVIILALVEQPGRFPAQRALLASVSVGMGFALLENLEYLVRAPEVMGLAFARACTAVPAHMLLAMLLGSFVVRARVYPDQRGLLLTIGFLLAAFLHGGYDYVVMTHAVNSTVSLRLFQLGGLLAIIAFNRALSLAQVADEEAGDVWPSPPRVRRFLGGLIALPWPVVVILVAAALKLPAAGMSALFPGLIALDLFRSAFARAQPTRGDRLALRL